MTTAKNRPRRTRQAGAAGLLLATGLSIAVTPPPAQAAQGVTSLAQVDCVDSTRLAQIRGDGTQLWLSSLTRSDSDQPTVYGWQKIYTFNQQAASVAMLSSDDAINRMLVSFTDGSLRSYTWNTDTRTMVVKDLTPDAADKKYDFRRLTYDGTRLYGNKGTDLYVMTSISTTAAPTAMSKVSGWGGYARSFFGNSATPNGELSWTGTDGKLRIGDVRNTTDGWTMTTRAVADKLYPEHTITSPGGGILLRTVNTGDLWRHHLNTDATTTSTHQTLATTTGAPDLPITTSPETCQVAAPEATVASRVLTTARGQVGVLETSDDAEKYFDWNSQWDGWSVDTTPWCAGFVSWVVNYKTKATTFKSALVQSWYLEAKSRNHGLSLTSTPRPGDIVVFDWDGSGDFGAPLSHTGIVESVGGNGAFTAIEGNASGSPDGVYRKSRTSQAPDYAVAFIRIAG